MVESSSEDTNTVSSSVKSENLREIWKILDANAIDNDDDQVPTNDKISSVLRVTGVKPPTVTAAVGSTSERKTSGGLKSPKTPKSPAIKKPTQKIRNYNIKD